MSRYVSVKCACCNNDFDKTVRRYNEAIKNGWLFYCGRECYSKHKTIAKNLKCSNCKNDIVVSNHDFNDSKTKRFFCSQNCAASFNNKIRGKRSEETKQKIKKSVLVFNRGNNYIENYEKICPVCSNKYVPLRDSQKFCSKLCVHIYEFGRGFFTKEEIISLILEKSKELNETPTKKSCKKFLTSSINLFGTWNNAIKACGLKPNINLYPHTRLRSADGHMCDSLSERIVDNWLFSNGFIHDKNKNYPESRKNCDFYVPLKDLWIEYFGLLGDNKIYDDGVEMKREMAKKFNLNLIEIVRDDIYPDIKLNEKLKNYM